MSDPADRRKLPPNSPRVKLPLAAFLVATSLALAGASLAQPAGNASQKYPDVVKVEVRADGGRSVAVDLPGR